MVKDYENRLWNDLHNLKEKVNYSHLNIVTSVSMYEYE
jgi:hypothetical protein